MKRIPMLLALPLTLVVAACTSENATTPSPATPEPTPAATEDAAEILEALP